MPWNPQLKTPPPELIIVTDSEDEDLLRSLDIRQDIGFSQFPELTGSPIYQRESPTSRDSWNEALVASSTTSSSPRLPRRGPFPRLRATSPPPPTQNQLDQLLQGDIAGNLSPRLGNLLNLELSLFGATRLQTGIESVLMHLPDEWNEFPVRFTFDITQISIDYVLIIRNLLSDLLSARFSGVQLELENPIRPGNWQDQTLILKIRALNFGAATTVTRLLSLMNLEVLSIFPTFYDGWTNIQSELRQKEAQEFWLQHVFTLPLTFIHPTGIPR